MSFPGYSVADLARRVDEGQKAAHRSAFERDRARVLHSAALRRLAAKTQVVDPGESDFPRTRLTHSLECAQVGRELGRVLGCDPDLVDAACLAHDLGHPPFGHNGEAALDALAAPCGGFEGNAQTFRLLTRLEAKVISDAGSAGLNLTRASLDAVLKYPWTKAQRPSGTDKYGCYAEDAAMLAWVRDGATARRPSFEAQVMDWADDVAYSVHDLEDGLYAGHITLDALRDTAQRRAVCELTAASYCDARTVELEEVFADLVDEPFWPRAYDRGPGALAAAKNLTSELIGRFCRAAAEATRHRYGPGALTRYAAELVVPRRQRLECALLKGVTAHYVMRRDGVTQLRARQRELIIELAGAVAERGAPALDPVLRPAFELAESDEQRLRVVVDHIASLTDASALAAHAGLSGGG